MSVWIPHPSIRPPCVFGWGIPPFEEEEEASVYTLVSGSPFTQSSTGQSLAITGLDGDAHGLYFILARIIIPSATTQNLFLRYNSGDQANVVSKANANWGAGAQTTDARLATLSNQFTGSPLSILWRIWVAAGKTLGGTAIQRGFSAVGTLLGDDANANSLGSHQLGADSVWDETATNLSSLQFHSSDANGIIADSQALVWRLTNSFTP